ncbi:4-amino-4-deoxy-L-arabinose transferase OS=Bosea thiooxidans OX=53254 GN=ARD30_08600 PE=4 SV=1 [Bosea thiooxidans]
MQSLLLRGSPSRTFFVGTDGVQAPLALRLMGVISVVMIGVGLFFGFFRALTFRLPGEREARKPRRPWPSSASVLLALAGAAFPVTVIFKMTSTGWEVGNRLGAFAMIGAGFVCALGVTFWGRWLERTGRTALAGVLALMIAGGIVNGAAHPTAIRSRRTASRSNRSASPWPGGCGR